MRREHAKNLLGRFLLTLLVLFWAMPACEAANHFVRSAASPGGTGADWTTAFTDLPANLIRGDIYYVAAGTYREHMFNDPDSTTLPIEIRAATVADHGTSVGWSDSFQGTATFSTTGSGTPSHCIFEFQSDFYLINGNGVRGMDWQSGYLIRLDDSNSLASECVVLIGQGAQARDLTGHLVHDVTLDYIESNGSHTTTDSGINELGVESRCGGSNITVRHSYVHDGGSVLLWVKGMHDSTGDTGLCATGSTGSQWTSEYNYLARSYSSAAKHGAATVCDEGQFCVFRYNRFRDIDGTAFFDSASGGGAATNNIDNQWEIYGNWLEGKNSFTLNGVQCGVAGAIQAFDVIFSGPIKFYNNTMANVNSTICAGGATADILVLSTAQLKAGLFVQNNLWFQTDRFTAVTSCNCSTLVWDHNAYFNQSITDADPNAQISSGDPFVGSALENFHLASATAAGATLAAPYNTDQDGTTRGVDGVWDRGAFEFDSGKRPPLPPPTVSAVVH